MSALGVLSGGAVGHPLLAGCACQRQFDSMIDTNAAVEQLPQSGQQPEPAVCHKNQKHRQTDEARRLRAPPVDAVNDRRAVRSGAACEDIHRLEHDVQPVQEERVEDVQHVLGLVVQQVVGDDVQQAGEVAGRAEGAAAVLLWGRGRRWR